MPQDVTLRSGSAGSSTPFIGCIRDILIGNEVINFNGGILYYTPGIEMGGVCKTAGDIPEDPEGTTVAPTDSTIPYVTPRTPPPFRTTTTRRPFSERYGECKLPLVPELEQDLSNTKGLRFGTKPETLLEFNKHLKVRKLSEFKIEFKTSHSGMTHS